ncbi:MAG: FHA domain-containing protein [Anaerolineae bacterium]|nr:FHA domain-containing protein [Anaerolineae bacterium]
MRDHMPWLRAIGALWLGVGALALVWGVVALLSVSLSRTALPESGAFWDQFRVSPWAEVAALAWGAFALIAGWGLIRRRSWAQTLLVPAHLLLMLYAVVGWIAAQALLARGAAPYTGGAVRWAVPIVFGALIAANAGLLTFMRSAGTTEALSWLPLRTMPAIALRCEFCGAPLDPETQRCPQCDAIPAPVSHPPLARLVSLSDQATTPLSPDRPTRIGRGRSENDLNLGNPTVSRRHAQIAFSGGQYVLTALQDSNGTFVNDALIREHALQDGDEIRFGRVRFRFEIVPIQTSEAPHA